MAVAARSILDIVESAYDTSLDGQEWLTGAVEKFSERFPNVVGWGGHVITKTHSGPPHFHHAVLSNVDDAMSVFGPMHAAMKPVVAEALFPNGMRCGLFTEHLAQITRSHELDAPTHAMMNGLTDYLHSAGGDDLLFCTGYDHTGSGVLLGAIVKGTSLSEPVRELHRLATVHVAAAWRMRRALVPDPLADKRTEAIFEADGRLAHADGPAKGEDMRALLRDAVMRVDRARTTGVRANDVEALALWQGLVDGRWSLIDRYDSDGRRYYVAVANPPDGIAARQLTQVEAQVVAQVVAGDPNKVIAYSLGAAESTVAGHLASAMRKLGATSRMDVVRLGRALGATGATSS
jgi:DNA-binding CsgD family transcriptional regulator